MKVFWIFDSQHQQLRKLSVREREDECTTSSGDYKAVKFGIACFAHKHIYERISVRCVCLNVVCARMLLLAHLLAPSPELSRPMLAEIVQDSTKVSRPKSTKIIEIYKIAKEQINNEAQRDLCASNAVRRFPWPTRSLSPLFFPAIFCCCRFPLVLFSFRFVFHPITIFFRY